MKPVIPWMGGKGRLAKQILPMFPSHTCYVEPFAGAGALLFAREHPAKAEVLNDINADLVNLYRVLKHHLEALLTEFKWALHSRQLFDWAKLSHPDTLTDIQRAARFYYLIKSGFGAKVTSPTFGTSTTSPPKLNLMRLEEDFTAAWHRLARVTIEHLPWDECIRRYDRKHTLFYCDPPYLGTAGYGVPFGLEQYSKMAHLAQTIKGRMIISVGDTLTMRKAFDGLTINTVPITYTVGGNKQAKKAQELIIRSW